MARKLIIDGNAVYEIDEECMLKNRIDNNEHSRDCSKEKSGNNRYGEEKGTDQSEEGRGSRRKM